MRYAFANGTVIEQMLEHSVRNDGPSVTEAQSLSPSFAASVHGLRSLRLCEASSLPWHSRAVTVTGALAVGSAAAPLPSRVVRCGPVPVRACAGPHSLGAD